MKQKLAIISALIHEPKLLILDELFVGLDPKAALTCKKLFDSKILFNLSLMLPFFMVSKIALAIALKPTA